MHSEPSSPCHLYSHTAPYGGERHHKVLNNVGLSPLQRFVKCTLTKVLIACIRIHRGVA